MLFSSHVAGQNVRVQVKLTRLSKESGVGLYKRWMELTLWLSGQYFVVLTASTKLDGGVGRPDSFTLMRAHLVSKSAVHNMHPFALLFVFLFLLSWPNLYRHR